MKAAIYCRVSTTGQDAAVQLPEIEQLCATRGWSITHRYSETVSGTAKSKPQLDAMLAAAHRGEFKAVVVWALDRLGRGGIADVAGIVSRLDKAGVALVSVRENWADGTGPVRSLLVAVMAWVAEQERARLGERTKAGLVEARRKGKRLGRPPVDRTKVDDALARVGRGERLLDVAAEMKLGASTIRRERRAKLAAASA
jgi:DNA invertase Pin-like site-specific DNA recombinase